MSNPSASTQRRPGAFSAARSRVADLLGRAGKAAALARLALAPPMPPAPPVDRAALVNYATFLAWERNRVCAELYPHLGAKAESFVLGENAAERFFYPDGVGDGLSRSWRDVPPASTRAVAVLDLVGVDWRSDPPGDAMERSIGARECFDTGERPAVPYGWPAIDAALVAAADDLARLDAAVAALIDDDERDAVDVPGYGALEAARDQALTTLSVEPARSPRGLQAKARAIRSVDGESDWSADLAQSLARDLLAIDGRAIEPQPDPIFAVIEEARRLTREQARLFAISGGLPETHPTAEATAASHKAMWEHVRGVLLETVPATAAGCVALARFAREFTAEQGVPLEYESNDPVLALIALSPAR